jgi:hypothetical protein
VDVEKIKRGLLAGLAIPQEGASKQSDQTLRVIFVLTSSPSGSKLPSALRENKKSRCRGI